MDVMLSVHDFGRDWIWWESHRIKRERLQIKFHLMAYEFIIKVSIKKKIVLFVAMRWR